MKKQEVLDMNKEQIKELQKELKEQDNVSDENPFYVVYEFEKIYYDGGNSEDEDYIWINEDCEEIDEEDLYEELGEFEYNPEEISYEEHEKVCDFAEKKGYKKIYYDGGRKFVSAFFTRKSAKSFIKQNDYTWNKQYICVESLWRNDEMKDIRNHFLNIDLGEDE
jgi:hypothetical protein